MLICREICFVDIYAVLAQNLFCRDLRTFVWRKVYSEIVLEEKKGQISGMPVQDLRIENPWYDAMFNLKILVISFLIENFWQSLTNILQN